MNRKLLWMLLLLPGMALADTSIIVRVGPPAPPPRAVVGVAPGPGFVWTDGYWNWNGARYVWTPGRWMRPPRRRAVWVPAHWARRRRGWVLVPGRWR